MTEAEAWKAQALDRLERIREAREAVNRANPPPKEQKTLNEKPEALVGKDDGWED